MLFNTFEFLSFFMVVLSLFVLTNWEKTITVRNIILLGASFYFYAQLNIYFPLLLVYVGAVTYILGYLISKHIENIKKSKWIVAISTVLSLLPLVFFKYAYIWDKSILLPVGLSFFTFQGLTYTIDIYRKKIEVEKNIINYILFVSFFPSLLSGPIERARNMLPQYKNRTVIDWNSIVDGSALFICGMFKKVVIADRLADYVNLVYLNTESHTGSTLALAAVFYSFQIYCDFSGYADMAIGVGRVLGFRIMQNFNLPYCASTVKEFWRRWHISLTSWFTEYVYISLGGNRVPKYRWVINISLVFLLSGIWHGATWSFVLWGAIHAVIYLIEHYICPKKPGVIYHLYVFAMVTFAWVFFRIENSGEAANVIYKICTDLISPVFMGSSAFTTILTITLLLIFIIREWLEYRNIIKHKYIIEYVLLIIAIALFGVSSSQFVYFQF